ncbi:MAG TPA: G1 family glutamic endopeptidase [Trebonia sp.]|jgi:hypothetical protein|nr:G1 family glutamic endopeptidase [Trebonia sp.]
MTRRLPRFLLYPLAAALPALGLIIGLGAAAGASTVPAATTAPARVTAPAGATALARAAIKDLRIGQHSTVEPAHGFARQIRGQSAEDTYNWSGYADTGSGYSEVGGSWTEPGATCGSQETLAAFWVGIDGFSSSSVEQDGTLIECYDGTPYQYSWWEMYPTNAIQVVGESVSPGDQITASVQASGTSYALSVTDSTNPANSFSTTQSCSDCANSSAEWIAEAPSGSDGIYPLTDFGSWTLNNASVAEGSSSGSISSFPDTEITMIDTSGNVEAEPGSLSDGGTAFPVTWESSS